MALVALTTLPFASHAAELVHDSEYYVLEAQNGEKWAADDKIGGR